MPVKKVICNSIKYAFAFEVSSVSSTEITLKSGYTLHTINAMNAVLSKDLKRSDEGPYWVQSLQIVTNDSSASHDLMEQDIIFKLQLEDESTLTMGSIAEPARFVSGEQELEGYKLKIERASSQELT